MERRKFLETEWSPKNEKTFSSYKTGSKFRAWWQHWCKCGEKHEWANTIENRFKRGDNCSKCSGMGPNSKNICICRSLLKLRPDLAKEWHPTKNILRPEQVSINSGKKVWWICGKSECLHTHEWEAVISNRTKNFGCPFCSGLKRCSCNSFMKNRPELLLEWHPTKNKIKPEDVAEFSNIRVWWKCLKAKCDHHVWKSSICVRSSGGNCPFCVNQKVCICNSLLTLRPDLAKEWSDRNLVKASEISLGSSREKFWWICKKRHEWQSIVAIRTAKNGSGCPRCASSKGEKTVKEVLAKLNIKHVPQKKINPKPDLRLYLDFYLPDHNLAIEFDGEQHFRPIKFFGGEEKFERLQLNDAHKNLYCIENGISLLRIHHSEAEEIEKIVRQSLNFYGRNGPWLFLSGLHPDS